MQTKAQQKRIQDVSWMLEQGTRVGDDITNDNVLFLSGLLADVSKDT